MKAEVLQAPNIGNKVRAISNVPQSVWADLCKNMLKRMRDRVSMGKDHNNRSFKEYAPSTAAKKREIGRGAVVNMNDRGTMIKSLDYTTTSRYGEMFLGAEKHIGYKHQKGIGVPRREWFGYTKKSAEATREEFRKYLRRALAK